MAVVLDREPNLGEEEKRPRQPEAHYGASERVYFDSDRNTGPLSDPYSVTPPWLPTDTNRQSGKKDERHTEPLKAISTNTGALPTENDGQSSTGGRLKRFFLGNNKRKAATIGGGIFGGGGIVALMMMLGIASGPFEFIHLAQLLTSPLTSFGHINAASDYRMGRMLYDIYKTGNFSVVDAGDTRIGVLGRALKKPILEGLTDKGITINFGTLKTFDGFTIDISHPNSPFYGDTQEEAVAKLQNLIGDNSKLAITFSPDVPDQIHVAGVGFNGDAAAIDAVANFISIKGLDGPVASYVGSRFLLKYSAARTFHPLQKWLVQQAQKVADWWVARNNSISEGETKDGINTAGATEETTDAKGQTVDTAVPGESGTLTTPDVATKLSGLSGLKAGATVTGGLATVLAIVCLLQAINKNIGLIRWGQVMLPMMREAMDVITTGSQIMSGKDVNMDEVKQMATQFQTINATTHKVVSTWSGAAPFVAMAGGVGGEDLNSATKAAFSATPAWLSWTTAPAVQTLCSNTAQIAAGVISVTIGVFSGEVVSTVIGLAAGAIAGPAIISFVSNLVSGSALNPATLSGAQWGNVVAYGAQLAGNAQAIQAGGVALTNQQVAVLDNKDSQQSQQEFQSESLADRALNPSDYRSIVGSAIDQLNLAGGPQSVLADITNLPSIFSSLLRMPATLFSATVHAATTGYQYPFPEFGFSQSDLTNAADQDPMSNAKAAGTLLDNNNTNGEPDYISKALDCFGVEVSKGSDGWDAVPSTTAPTDGGYAQDRTNGVDVYDATTYNQSDCTDSSDANWTKVRLWILDSRTMEGYACYMGDQTSCNNVSFNGETNAANAAANGGGAGGNGSCMSNPGDGPFTDATTPIPTNLPNKLPVSVQQMCQRAQTLANETSTGSATSVANHSSLFAQWCNGSAGGSGVVLGSGDCSTSGQCDYTASFIWGYGNSGYGFATANNNTPISGIQYHWNSLLATYPQFAHPNDTHPPVGALLFYNNAVYHGGGGHVTVYLGNNWVATSDMSATSNGAGANHPGQVAIVHASAITNGTWTESYLGWADPIIMGTPL